MTGGYRARFEGFFCWSVRRFRSGFCYAWTLVVNFLLGLCRQTSASGDDERSLRDVTSTKLRDVCRGCYNCPSVWCCLRKRCPWRSRRNPRSFIRQTHEPYSVLLNSIGGPCLWLRDSFGCDIGTICNGATADIFLLITLIVDSQIFSVLYAFLKRSKGGFEEVGPSPYATPRVSLNIQLPQLSIRETIFAFA